MRNRIIIMIIAASLSFAGIGQVMAAGQFYDYNITAPKFGGSTTGNNYTKVSASEPAVVCSEQIGADYRLDVRVETVSNDAQSGYSEIGDFTRVELFYSSPVAGAQYHIRYRNKWYTPVDVQAIGHSSPDNPGGCDF